MGLFSESNKKNKNPSDKDKFFSDFDNTFKKFVKKFFGVDIEDIENKVQDGYLILYLYFVGFDNDKYIRIQAEISRPSSLLNDISSTKFFKKAWKNVKEKFKKEVDEQELYKIFKFLMFISFIYVILEFAKQKRSPLNVINSTSGYNHYTSSSFNGKLDEKTFRELAEKIWKYIEGEVIEEYKQYIRQKVKES